MGKENQIESLHGFRHVTDLRERRPTNSPLHTVLGYAAHGMDVAFQQLQRKCCATGVHTAAPSGKSTSTELQFEQVLSSLQAAAAAEAAEAQEVMSASAASPASATYSYSGPMPDTEEPLDMSATAIEFRMFAGQQSRGRLCLGRRLSSNLEKPEDFALDPEAYKVAEVERPPKTIVKTTIWNLEYEKLDASAHAQLRAKIRTSIAHNVGVPETLVFVKLFAGSVKIKVEVRPALWSIWDGESDEDALDAESIKDAIEEFSSAIMDDIVKGAKSVPQIQNATTGEISVAELQVAIDPPPRPPPPDPFDHEWNFGDMEEGETCPKFMRMHSKWKADRGLRQLHTPEAPTDSETDWISRQCAKLFDHDGSTRIFEACCSKNATMAAYRAGIDICSEAADAPIDDHSIHPQTKQEDSRECFKGAPDPFLGESDLSKYRSMPFTSPQ